ncbi:MAG: bifunctional folylpolyglutamate synthase/dihydrofolate synthase [Microbacteriaceae bacterium]|nr:bifunctional folylpolyglutamate synthase/dihydrofolate synthase [Microbacteriaceae bacterium]
MSKKDGSNGELNFDDPELSDDALFQKQADRVYAALMSRVGEQAPQPRLGATRRVVELLGDPQRAYPIIHVTGTNGKTSTTRIIESILRAYGLRTGMMTSPHLVRLNERIMIDGQSISNADLVANWDDITPYIAMVDVELSAAGEEPLSYFEALTVLAFACFADAPVDVAVIEVGMGGEWDSTNVGDGQVAVFTSISLDHTARLGNTVAEIARTKSGIIKPLAAVVTAGQSSDVLAELTRAAELTESTIAVSGDQFSLVSNTVAVGGQVITVAGVAGRYEDLFLPLFGDHQAHNAAVAIAAVESFLGGGTQMLVGDVLAEGLATATSPGRLQVIGIEPTVIVDAAHNPDGARALAVAMGSYFTFDEICLVVGVLDEKDGAGILAHLAPIARRIMVTRSTSPRAIGVDELADVAAEISGDDAIVRFDSLAEAIEAARDWANEKDKRAVLVAGSITLVGDVMALASEQGWRR